MHVGAVSCMALLAVGRAARARSISTGVALVAALLIYEQSLVSRDDLSQVKRAFDLNGYVGILYFVTTAVARVRWIRIAGHGSTALGRRRHGAETWTSIALERRISIDLDFGLRTAHSTTMVLDKSPDRISGMFDAIAPRYDLLNTVLSAGLDRYWRRSRDPIAGVHGRETLLDVCTGTGDVALAAARARRGAPTRGRRRLRRRDAVARASRRSATRVWRRACSWCAATRCTCRCRHTSVDGVTIAFGIRNVAKPETACAELLRVLRPGGRLAILEFGLPVVPAVRPLYLWYFRHVLPRIGRAVSRHDAAYSYLPASVGAFPWGERSPTILARARI